MMGSTPVTLTQPPSGAHYASGTLTANWLGVTASSYLVSLSNGQMLSGCTFTNGSTSFSCNPGIHIPGTPSTSINVSPTTMSVTTNLTVWKAIVVTASPTSVTAGTSTQVTWTPPAGATGCTLTSNGQGTPTYPIATDNGPTSGNAEPVATYTSAAADAGTTVTITAACTTGAGGATPASAPLTVN